MIVMVCVDNQNGMMFNHRRQSQDRGLRRRMCEIAGNDDGKFWMNAYSRQIRKVHMLRSAWQRIF